MLKNPVFNITVRAFLTCVLYFFATNFSQAATFEFSQDGNSFASASGQYATNSHCVAGDTCSWVSGNQIIIGAYSSYTGSWTGGSVRWDFNINVAPQDIERAELWIEWPQLYGKGLHSPEPWRQGQGEGRVSVKSIDNVIATLKTDVATCSPTNDYYAHPCGTWSLNFNVPIDLIESPATKVYVDVNNKTIWDISKLTLFFYTRTGDVFISNGKIYVKGEQFLVKCIDYAPWLIGTGPDPHLQHEPFPGEYEDVTDKVTHNGTIYVPDYDGNGRVEAWEVIRYDLEKMKAAGANTIRVYGSGEWHDKNLNGIRDASDIPEQSEIVQGDIPEWMLERIVAFLQANDMKIILGYWVQEEDFASGLETNENDLEVATDTLERLVNKYGADPAVLAWGIGNEVHGSWNRTWFTWTADINWYLNTLFSSVRHVDTAHKPIMYAKYVGEETDFNNLTADIIAVNAYALSAEELIATGELATPPPEGKAYLLGEFGHMIEQANGQWELAQQYAGGCFLEYNDVWWKGEGQDLLGIVEEYRKIKPDRYNKVSSLFNGCLKGDANLDENVNILDVIKVMRISLGIDSAPITESEWCLTDVDYNRQIDILDAIAILRSVLGLN